MFTLSSAKYFITEKKKTFQLWDKGKVESDYTDQTLQKRNATHIGVAEKTVGIASFKEDIANCAHQKNEKLIEEWGNCVHFVINGGS